MDTFKRKIEESSVPGILNGTYFKVLSSENGKVLAECTTCNAKIKGRLHPTSNFTTHLNQHNEKLEEYKKMQKFGFCKKQKQLDFPVLSKTSTEKERAERLIMEYIINSMSPLSTVENEAFIKLVKGLNSSASVPTRRTLMTRINSEFESKIQKLKTELINVRWTCTTADIWSARNRSFMGITVHWIDAYFKRNSAVLMMKRFSGSHTNDKIAEILSKCFNSFNITRKIVTVVTDNASNFIKAFREYGFRVSSDGEMVEDRNESEDENDEETEASQNGDVFERFNEEEFADLPPHYRCVSHSLSLVATTDFKSALNTGFGGEKQATKFKKVMRDSFSKCSAFWNKVGRSVQAAEAVKVVFGKSVITPSNTRWNSTFDSVAFLIEKEALVDQAFDICKVTKLNQAEKDLLKEYHVAMAPIAWSLDKMQSQNDIFFGYVAPILVKCEKKLQELGNSDTCYGKYIARSLLVGLKKRFGDIISLCPTNALNEILAAISLPCFKLWWVSVEKREELKMIFLKELAIWNERETSMVIQSKTTIGKEKDDLFDFEPPSNTTVGNNVELECIQYLQDADTRIESLMKYPTILKMSLKYNTPLPSSAPAERLFSYGGMILRPQRARLSDETFEKLIFLKLNGFRK